MKRSETEIWAEQGRDAVADARPKRRKDTDLSEISVRKSRRELRREEEEAERASPEVTDTMERAPWDEPADPRQAIPAGGEPASGDPPAEKNKDNTLVSVLSGNILSKSEVKRAYPYMIFVACLMFLYIANIFRTQYIYREHARLTEQVKELRAKSMTIASDKMKATRQSNILIELERRGIPLRESLTPNKVIPNPKPTQDGTQKDDR